MAPKAKAGISVRASPKARASTSSPVPKVRASAATSVAKPYPVRRDTLLKERVVSTSSGAKAKARIASSSPQGQQPAPLEFGGGGYAGHGVGGEAQSALARRRISREVVTEILQNDCAAGIQVRDDEVSIGSQVEDIPANIRELILSAFEKIEQCGLANLMAKVRDEEHESFERALDLLSLDGREQISFDDFRAWAWTGDKDKCIRKLTDLDRIHSVGRDPPVCDSNPASSSSGTSDSLSCELWKILLGFELNRPEVVREILWTEGATLKFNFLQACFQEQENNDDASYAAMRRKLWATLGEAARDELASLPSLDEDAQANFFSQVVEDDEQASVSTEHTESPVGSDSRHGSPRIGGHTRQRSSVGSPPTSPAATDSRSGSPRTAGYTRQRGSVGSPPTSKTGPAQRLASPARRTPSPALRRPSPARSAQAVTVEPAVLNRAYRASREERLAARRRLSELLLEHGVEEKFISGDGSCQFRAMSDQLYGNDNRHSALRKRVCAHLKAHSDRYSCFVPGPFDRYLIRMERLATWGDNVTLQAAADMLGLRIFVLSDYPVDPIKVVTPADQKNTQVLLLCFHAEVHYSSTRPLPPERAGAKMKPRP